MYFTLDLVTSVEDWRNSAASSCLPPERNWQQNWAGGCWLAGICPTGFCLLHLADIFLF